MSLFLGNFYENDGSPTDCITQDMLRKDYPLTISGWGKNPNAARTNDVIIATAGGQSTTNCVRLGLTANKGYFRVNGGGNNALSAAVAANNAWMNIIGVGASATDRKCYLNGGNVGSNANNVTCTSTGNATIGAQRAGNPVTDSGWLGWIAEIAVWNEALTASEVDALGHGENPMHIRIWALIYYNPLYCTIVPRFPGGIPGNLRRWGNPAFSGDHPPVIPTEIANRRFFMPMDQVLRVHRGTGALVSGPAILTAAGKRVSQGTAALQSGPAVLDATGQRVLHGAAALHSGPAVLDATGQRASQGSAALQSGPAHLAATGQRGIQGVAALHSGAAHLTASGQRAIQGTGVLVSGPAHLLGSGWRVHHGVATLQSGPATLDATGQRVLHGTASLQSGPAHLSAAGKRVVQGLAHLVSSPAYLVAVGQRGIQGAGVLVSGPATLHGEGGPVHSVLESPFGIPALWFIRTIEPFDTEDAVWLDADGRLRVSQNYVTDCHSETVTTSRPIAAADADALLLIDGTVTLTLPNLTLPGTRLYVMVKTGGSSCAFVAGAGASIITKGTATSLASVGSYAEVVYAGGGVWALLSNDLT